MKTVEQYRQEYKVLNACPAIFADAPHSNRSKNYKLLSSLDFIREMEKINFYPTKVLSERSPNLEKAMTQKHVINFRPKEYKTNKHEVIPEILFQNSHDGSSSYKVTAGVFRFICSNGLVIGDISFQRSILHKGNALQEVMDSVGKIIEILPKSIQKVDEWSQIELSEADKFQFATQAALLKWDEIESVPVSVEELLKPKRERDLGNDLWTVFNVLQEKIIRGGVEYVRPNGRHSRTRPINQVRKNIITNKELWNLAEATALTIK